MSVGLVIVSHSAKLAEGVVELAGQMVQGKISLAAAGGSSVASILGTSVEKIKAAIEAVDGPDGVLVLFDLGSALLSAEMALEMLSDEQRGRVYMTIAPLVEGAVTAALEASLGRTLAEVRYAAEQMASSEALRKLKPLNQGEEPSIPDPSAAATATSEQQAIRSSSQSSPSSQLLEVQLPITHPSGLHARPASLFVQTAARFKQARVRAIAHGREVSATSIVSVLSLGVRQGETVTIRASGEEAEAALAALSELVRTNFGETAS